MEFGYQPGRERLSFRCPGGEGKDHGDGMCLILTCAFQQIQPADEFPNTNPTSGGRTGERIVRLAPRETLDDVAYRSFGRTDLWRAIAAFNGIDDPLRLQPGAEILLPASVDDLEKFA